MGKTFIPTATTKQAQLTIGQQLKELRDKHHLSQQVMAECLNVSRSTYQKYEIDDTPLSTDVLKILHTDFGVDLNILVCGTTKEKMIQMIGERLALEIIKTIDRECLTSVFDHLSPELRSPLRHK